MDQTRKRHRIEALAKLPPKIPILCQFELMDQGSIMEEGVGEKMDEVIEDGSDLGWETDGRHDGKQFHDGRQVGQRGAVRRNEAESNIN